MDLSLSTLGCPNWDFNQICSVASHAGYDGVDIRGYQEKIDITQHPIFTCRAEEAKNCLEREGLTISALGSSIHLCERNTKEENLEEARRLIDIGEVFDVSQIRVFGGGDIDERSRNDLVRIGRETIENILNIDGADQFQWILETHDIWTASKDWQLLLDEFPEENTGILWDAAHTIRLADESPTVTLDAIGDQLSHVHLKDAIYRPDHPDSTDDGYLYTVPDIGELPITDVVQELYSREYDGWIVFEHEKRWHPSIMEPEEAFPRFIDWFDSIE